MKMGKVKQMVDCHFHINKNNSGRTDLVDYKLNSANKEYCVGMHLNLV